MTMTEKKVHNGWGGAGRGQGKKPGNRHCALNVRVSQEAMDALNERTRFKSEFIDNLLLNLPPGIDCHGLMPIRKANGNAGNAQA